MTNQWHFAFNFLETLYKTSNWIIRFCLKVPKSDEEYDLRVPRDMAYIFSGAYIPLSCKLIEQVSKSAGFTVSTGSDWFGLFSISAMMKLC